jgi:hypothetical protein
MRSQLLSFREPHPLELPQLGRVWLRVPTAKDVLDLEGKDAGFYLVRFLCDEDGSPMFREDETGDALRIPAWIATAVVEEVGKLMQPPPHSREAATHAPRIETRQVVGGDGEADCHGALSLVAVG